MFRKFRSTFSTYFCVENSLVSDCLLIKQILKFDFPDNDASYTVDSFIVVELTTIADFSCHSL